MQYIKRLFSIFFYTLLLLLVSRVLFLLFTNLGHNYGDRVWQPFETRDSMVFNSSKGDTVGFCISQIVRYNSPSEPLLPLSHPRISTVVYITSHNRAIVDISTELGKKKVTLNAPFRVSHINVYENEASLRCFKINDIDVILLERNETNRDGSPYLQKVYWSSQYGYIRAIYSDGETWELKSFTRNGKSMYPCL